MRLGSFPLAAFSFAIVALFPFRGSEFIATSLSLSQALEMRPALSRSTASSLMRLSTLMVQDMLVCTTCWIQKKVSRRLRISSMNLHSGKKKRHHRAAKPSIPGISLHLLAEVQNLDFKAQWKRPISSSRLFFLEDQLKNRSASKNYETLEKTLNIQHNIWTTKQIQLCWSCHATYPPGPPDGNVGKNWSIHGHIHRKELEISKVAFILQWTLSLKKKGTRVRARSSPGDGF
jgi:hypothetical protein